MAARTCLRKRLDCRCCISSNSSFDDLAEVSIDNYFCSNKKWGFGVTFWNLIAKCIADPILDFTLRLGTVDDTSLIQPEALLVVINFNFSGGDNKTAVSSNKSCRL